MEYFNEAWSIVCDFCKTKITSVAYKTWIDRIEPLTLNFEKRKALLVAPNEFHRQTLKKCYTELIKEAFLEIFDSDIDIDFTIPEELSKYKETKNILSSEYEFTFETFIVGPSNKFAHAATLAVASNPAGAYNPLFIYGNSGLGKTHLLYAIANDIKKNHPHKKSLYIKGDEFTNHLIDSIRNNSMIDFHQKYRNTDILLVDDIQFIAGKESTQEEFFHTFNSLYEAKKQIVLTSDRPPKEIQTLEDRLRTRFEWGLIADIQPPDFETRIAIIKRKAEVLSIKLPYDVCEYTAKKLKNNIRQLEGAVKKIKAHHLLGGQPINTKTAQLAISDILNNNQPPSITIEKIINEVAKTFDVKPSEIRSGKRIASISNARQISMYITKEITQLPLITIGHEFGGRDHSTIVYAIQQVEKTMTKDFKIKAMIEDIIQNIRGN